MSDQTDAFEQPMSGRFAFRIAVCDLREALWRAASRDFKRSHCPVTAANCWRMADKAHADANYWRNRLLEGLPEMHEHFQPHIGEERDE